MFSTPCLFHATFLWQVSGKNVSCVPRRVSGNALHGLCDIFAALGLRAPAIHVPGAMGSGKTRLGIHAAEKYRDVAEATAITGHINPNMRDVDASMLEHARAHRNKTSSPSTQSSSHPQTHTTLSPSCAFFHNSLKNQPKQLPPHRWANTAHLASPPLLTHSKLFVMSTAHHNEHSSSKCKTTKRTTKNTTKQLTTERLGGRGKDRQKCYMAMTTASGSFREKRKQRPACLRRK